MPPESIVNLGPLLQYGFAGAWLIQFSVFTWLGLRALEALGSVRDTAQGNTAAVAGLAAGIDELREDLREHPCHMTLEELRDLVRRLQPLARGE
jgi:hypothetical protein